MISVTIAFGIICLLFWIGKFVEDDLEEINKKETKIFRITKWILSYFIARILPGLMYQERNVQTWVSLLLEWMIFLILFIAYRNWKVIQYYLFQPATILLVLPGEKKKMLLLLVVVVIACIVEKKMRKKQFCVGKFHKELAVMSGSSFLMLAAGGEKKYPVLVCAMGVCLILAFIHILWKMQENNKNVARTVESTVQNVDNHISDLATGGKSKKMDKKDYICMIVLTLLFAIFVLYRLGSFKAPQTYEDFQVPDHNQIVLEFPKPVRLSKIEMYLGYKGKRMISFSYRKEGDNDWTVFAKDQTIQSVFCWNGVDVNVNEKVTEIGMVIQEEDARIHEIVCLDEKGKKVLPDNASEYAKLFDEQKLYPTEGTQYENSMFDEVYHARTAYEFLHCLSIYENTHPPLGKILISFGIAIFGMTPFGFRIVCALAGILMIPLVYLWARKMFANRGYAIFTTVLTETLFMNLTLARIATLDIIVALFVMGMFAAMYGYAKAVEEEKTIRRQYGWLLLSGVFMATAVASKWTGIYASTGLAVLFFVILYENGMLNDCKRNWKRLGQLALWCVLCFIVIPGTVYLLSYIPFARIYTDKNLLENAISNAQLMLSYHNSTVFAHPYASEWYEWLIDKRPLLDAYHVYKDGSICTVSTFLNPLTCFLGLVACVHQYYLMKKYKDRNAKYLGICYLSVMLPWLFIHRTVFIYQYFLGGLLLPFMIANSFRYLKNSRRKMIITGVVSVLLFLMFYPVLAGIQIPYQNAHQVLQWTKNWVFTL